MFDIETLELNKITAKIAEYAATFEAKDAILNMPVNTDVEKINKLLDEADIAREFIVKYSDLPRGNLDGVCEVINRIRLEAFLSIPDFMKLLNLIRCAFEIISYKDNLVSNKENLAVLAPYFEGVKENKKVHQEITLVINDNGEIFDNASLKLNDLRRKIRLHENSLRMKLNELLNKRAKMLSDNVIATRNGKQCLPVKAEYKNSFPGIIQGESASGSTFYIEPIESIEISNKLMSLKEDEKAEIARILMDLSVKVWNSYLELSDTFNNIVELDYIYAKGKYATLIDAYKPHVNTRGEIDIIEGKHPLIDPNKCVPIDIKLGKGYNGIIITGPNTGGKTVSLKTCGLLTLMMQSGILIPAKKESNLNIFENILADIGDEQSIEQSLSSFSAHMTKVISIVENTKYNSLVLFDELGSGTDPKEGSNLAIAIIESLLNKNARLIVTTHYTDLKVFAYNNDKVINASVEFNPDTLMPTYRLLLGVPGSSNAITIAKRLGLPNEITNRAQEINDEIQTDVSMLMKKLDIENQRLQKELENVRSKSKELEEKNEELIARDQELTRRYLNFEKDANKKAEQIINKAKEDAAKLIDQLKEKLANENLKEHEIADIKHKVSELGLKEEIADLEHEYNVNDMVYIKSYEQTGKIIRIKNDTFEVQMGNFTLKFKKHELAPYIDTKPVKKNIIIRRDDNKGGLGEIKQGKMELDLRGFRYEEVAPELEKFIYSAIQSNLKVIYVIHGFGSGAVRNACYEYFKKCKEIQSTRFGGPGEGLNGVTVITLK